MLYDLDVSIKFDRLTSYHNIAELLDEPVLARIAGYAREGYEADDTSREQWLKDNAEGMKLALQVAERKSEPWDGASNIKFPLISIAALHFQSRAYPLLVDNNNLVKMAVYGPDPKGLKRARADRVAAHMTWQCIEQIPEWEVEHDKATLITPILGSCYIKQWYSPVHRRPTVSAVSPANLVVNYWTKGDVNASPRATHVMEYNRNDIYTMVKRGVWLGHDGNELFCIPSVDAPDRLVQARDKRTGLIPPQADSTTPVVMLEQLTWIDLDGDGYAEPYVVTFEKDTGRLRRIVARWMPDGIHKDADDNILSIDPDIIYTKYGLIPAPDGSFMDLGFGRLLGPINAAVNTALNQMFDAGTLACYGGGFIGKGAKLKGGSYRFKPNEWKAVDSVGGDLKNNIVPLQVPDVPQVMFQLLTFLVNYGERLASASDFQMGENVGQNTKVGTAEMMNENGQRVFSGIFKRMWRSARDGFRAQYLINKYHLSEQADFTNVATGEGAVVMPDDYMAPAALVRPAADPNVIGESQLREQANMLVKLGQMFPGNRRKQLERVLRAYKVPAPDEVFPPPKEGEDYPTPPSPDMLKIQLEQARIKLEGDRDAVDKIDTLQRLVMDAKVAEAEVTSLMAKAMQAISAAKNDSEGNLVGLLQVAVSAYEKRLTGIVKGIETIIKSKGLMDSDVATVMGGMTNGAGGQVGEGAGGGEASMAGPSGDAGVAPMVGGVSA